MGRSAVAIAGLAGWAIACLDPSVPGPMPAGLKTWVASTESGSSAVASAVDAPVSASGLSGGYLLFGYELSLSELDLEPGPIEGTNEEICGELGRPLPMAKWVYQASSDDPSTFTELAVDATPPRAGPYEAERCESSGGFTTSRSGALSCLAGGPLTGGDAPVPPAPAVWPTACASFEECGRTLAPCAAGAYRFDVRAECEPIAVCPSDPWPDVSADVWVKEGAVGGDGTRARPYATIARALLDGPGLTIGLGSGRYELVGTSEVHLVGLCPSLTTLVLMRGEPHLLGGGIRGVRIEGDEPLPDDPLIFASDRLDLVEVEIVEVPRSPALGAIATVNAGVITGQRIATSGFTLAVSTSPRGRLELSELSVNDFDNIGVLVGATSTVTIHGAYLRPGVSIEPNSGSITVSGRLELTEAMLDGYERGALYGNRGSAVIADNFVVRGNDASLGAAIVLICPGPEGHRLSHTVVHGAAENGIVLGKGEGCSEQDSEVVLTDIHTARTSVRELDSNNISGIRIVGASGVTIDRYGSYLDSRAVTIGDETIRKIQLNDVDIVDPSTNDNDNDGVLHLECFDCEVIVNRARIVGAAHHGITAGRGRIHFDDLSIEGRGEGIGVSIADLGSIAMDLQGSRWAIKGFDHGVDLEVQQARIDQLEIEAKTTGLQMGLESKLGRSFERFRIAAAKPIDSRNGTRGFSLSEGVLLGPGAADSIRCAHAWDARMERIGIH